MKLRLILIVLVLPAVSHFTSYAQQKTNSGLGKPLKTQQNDIMNVQNGTSMTCKLSTPELIRRKETVIKQLKDNFTRKTELENGYSYLFNGDDQTLDMLTEFIKTERQCCDFFNFNIAVNNDGTITFSITGNKGAKEFITNELEF